MDPIFAALRIDIERTRARLPQELKVLADVVWNLGWVWLPDGPSLFAEIDAHQWEATAHNARAMLEGVSPRRLAELAADSAFVARAQALGERLREMLAAPLSPEADRVTQRNEGKPIAYFCAEYGLHESVPIYSGGLGVLAGDHLKSASDLGLPLLAVGLRYQQGYFHQGLDSTGWQVEYYENTDFSILPTGLILRPDGTPQTVEVPILGRRVVLQLWAMQVGRVPLLLLDSNREDNDPVDRWITGHLYGGDRDTRLAQEMVLGIGGIRALRLLGYEPAVFHMNEGHAAFLGLELVREQLNAGRSFSEAVARTRERSVFTTHTPVPAGHDTFRPEQVQSFMSAYFREFTEKGDPVAPAALLGLARKNPDDAGEAVNMTYLAMHTSRSINGVSELHAQVSREMFHWLWPGKSLEETPIQAVTNGVHTGTWMAPLMVELLDRYLGKGWETRQADPVLWEAIDHIPDAELWETHLRLKRRLVEFVRERTRAFRRASGEKAEIVDAASDLLDPEALTFGFARRVATYKRLTLLLHDPDRALSLLDVPGKPAQFVIAGKAHPHDSEAKRLVQYLFRVRSDRRVQKRATFLVDYDIAVARQLVQGVDVWLNLPRRPMEASGTSGMKAALNGAPNCSVLDGWWAEGYNGRNGWAVGAAEDINDPAAQDEIDADSLYSIIGKQIIPLYYERDEQDVPRGWVAMMKEAMKSAGPRFNTRRMLSEYATRIYAP